jgi:hypothetical protein
MEGRSESVSEGRWKRTAVLSMGVGRDKARL